MLFLDTVLSEVEAMKATAGGLRRGASVDHARHVQLRPGCAVCVFLILILKYHALNKTHTSKERPSLLPVYPIDEPLEQLDHQEFKEVFFDFLKTLLFVEVFDNQEPNPSSSTSPSLRAELDRLHNRL